MSSSTEGVEDIRLIQITEALRKRYGLSRHYNLRDAFWELIFIIVSTRTNEAVYLPVFRLLKKEFPDIDRLAAAPLVAIRRILKPAGLSQLKASQIRSIAKKIRRDFGNRGLTRFGRRNHVALEDYLCTFRGVGRKVAKCVTMYACDAPSLPVDAHAWRVLSRLGYAPGGRLTEKKALQLENCIEPNLRFATHVLCISHGREICGPMPKCAICPVRSACPSAA